MRQRCSNAVRSKSATAMGLGPELVNPSFDVLSCAGAQGPPSHESAASEDSAPRVHVNES